MTSPRRDLISDDITHYYHCVSRCVRRSFLFGYDTASKRNFSHRKAWLLERLKLLGDVFCIELCAYAVMSNHYHLVLRMAPEKAAALSDDEVIERWRQLYSGDALISRYLDEAPLSESERQSVQQTVTRWRRQLSDISWYMRALNEYIARRANREDDCKGRFWEGRFKSQAILDDVGLLACMAYVDLNPLRANMVASPEESTDISLHARLVAAQQSADTKLAAEAALPEQSTPPAPSDSLPAMMPFATATQRFEPRGAVIPCQLAEYLELLDWLGRQQRKADTATMSSAIPPLLQRLKLSPAALLATLAPHRVSKGSTIGTPASRRAFVKQIQRTRVHGPPLELIA